MKRIALIALVCLISLAFSSCTPSEPSVGQQPAAPLEEGAVKALRVRDE